MKFKTLVLNRGSKFQEFYGHEAEVGWVTCSSPIHMMSEEVTWEDIKKVFPDKDFDFKISLVTIEINILD